MGKPRDDKDAGKDIARDLAEITTHIGQLKGDANAYLSETSYDTLKRRLENALSAVEAATIEARRTVWLNQGSYAAPNIHRASIPAPYSSLSLAASACPSSVASTTKPV
jgi:hypothetical protein